MTYSNMKEEKDTNALTSAIEVKTMNMNSASLGAEETERRTLPELAHMTSGEIRSTPKIQSTLSQKQKWLYGIVGCAVVIQGVCLGVSAITNQDANVKSGSDPLEGALSGEDVGTQGASYCLSCDHAPTRWWSWWFGWGDCDCYSGWGGKCCDVPYLSNGQCSSYNDKFTLTHTHSVVPGLPFHAQMETTPHSGHWTLDALAQGLAPVVTNLLYLSIQEYPPAYVKLELDNLAAASKSDSYWDAFKSFAGLFGDILFDERLVEYEMLRELSACENVLGSLIEDGTGLTTLSVMAACEEAEVLAIVNAKGDEYKPTLAEYHDFWRLIEVQDDVLKAMVDHKTDLEPKAWMRSDDVFGWIRGVGSNPDMIRAATTSDISVDFAVTDAMYQNVMGSGAGTLAAAIGEGRVFILDFKIFGTGVQNNKGKTLFAPKALFAVDKSGSILKAIAIQPYQKPTAEHPLIAAPVPGRRDWDDATLTSAERTHLVRWAMAKTMVQVAESSYFEVGTHFGRTHLVMEPFMIAHSQSFYEGHPIGSLLSQHFDGTDHINQGAVDSLIAAGGVIDKIFPPPIELTQTIAIATCLDFLENINENMLPTTFKTRGVETLPKEYPYRDDGLLIWGAIHDFMLNYIKLTYASNDEMLSDPWLMCFWDKLVSANGGKLKKAGDNGDNVLRTREYLADFFTLIVWTGSGQHAATNFPQKDVGSHVTMNPTAAWSTGEMNGDVTLDNWMAMLPPLHEALDQVNTEYLLGSVHYNFLGRYGDGAFPRKYEGAQASFEAALDVVGEIVDARNAQLGTFRADKFNYEILHPGNCPNSINI